MNRLRLRKIIDKIQNDPKCWNQKDWHCGTAHCIAGHCQIEAGKFDHDLWCEDREKHEYVSADGRLYLNISFIQGRYLFDSERTLKQIIKFEKTNGEIPNE